MGVDAVAEQQFYTMKCVTVVALSVQVWELLATFFDEVEFVRTSKHTFVKYLYLWSRYFPLIIQIIEFVILEVIGTEGPSIGPSIYIRLNIFRAVVGQVLMTGIEIIMMIRVFALFNRSRRIRTLLISVFSVSFILEIIGTSMIIHTVRILPGSTRSDASPMSLAFFGAGISINQSVIAVMTSGKYIVGLQRGWARTPLVSLMMRDGGLVFTLFSVLLAIIVFYEVAGGLSPILWHASFAWYIALLSTAGCRMIINMRSLVLSASEPNQSIDTILTTEFIDDEVEFAALHG